MGHNASLTNNSAWKRYIENPERVYRWEEEVDPVGNEREGNGEGREKDP